VEGFASGTTICIIAHTGSLCKVPDAEKGEANIARVLLSVRVSPARVGSGAQARPRLDHTDGPTMTLPYFSSHTSLLLLIILLHSCYFTDTPDARSRGNSLLLYVHPSR